MSTMHDMTPSPYEQGYERGFEQGHEKGYAEGKRSIAVTKSRFREVQK